MNILLVSQFFSTTKGGGEYVFKTIANVMEKHEHKVWVITDQVKGEKYQDSKNLKIITVKPILEYHGGLPPTFSDNVKFVINAYREGRKILKNQKIDLIHSNNFSPALVGSLLCLFNKIPHVTAIHDIFSVYSRDFWKKWGNQPNVSKINSLLIPFYEKILMRLKFDLIHTVSESTKKDILKIGTHKPIHVIPNCIEFHEKIDIKPKTNQFVFLGRLVFYKNVEVIIRAFKLVTAQYPDAKLIIAGDGPQKNNLQKLSKNLEIESHVIFTGYVTRQQKENLLAESNALLFPSTVEGFGLVILESFQQKRPVVVSDLPPMSQIVENKKTGLVIDPHDEKKWSEAIIWLINNQNEATKMGEAGKFLVEEKYNQKKFYENLVKMYNELLINK